MSFWGWPTEALIQAAMEAGAAQEPAELAMAARMIAALSPRVVVEIGCDRGGTLLVWRQLCDRVYGITSDDNSYEAGGSGQPLDGHGAVIRWGDSHDPASRDWLASQLDVPVDALVIDGDHSEAGVLADVADYGPFVRPGGIILLHDIRSVGDPRDVAVHKAWPRLAARHETTELCSADGGPGWGVIHVGVNETYGGPDE